MPQDNMALSLFLGAATLWYLISFMVRGNQTPESDPSVESEGEPTTPICHRCLDPYHDGVHFYPKCGASVGVYNNLDPVDSILAVGEVMRGCTTGQSTMSAFKICGFLLVSLVIGGVYAPILWLVFLGSRFMNRNPSEPADAGSNPES